MTPRLLTCEALESRRLLAVDVQLVKDLNAEFDFKFTEVNGQMFFPAKQSSTGMELWVTDGSAAGTRLVKDINTQFSGFDSNPAKLVNVGGTLFFEANDGIHGRELWKSDGTELGTVLVKDINPGNVHANPGGFRQAAAVGNKLFFAATTGNEGRELWMSDGTDAGTTLVKDISSGAPSSSPAEIINHNGIVFFKAEDSSTGAELWSSDGTVANTQQVANIYPGSPSSNPSSLLSANGAVYFFARSNVDAAPKLWKSNGLLSGTEQVKDVHPPRKGAYFFSNPYLTNVSGTLYFAGDDDIHGAELWKSDGSALGTTMVTDINDEPGYSAFPHALANVSGKLFFVADDGEHGYEVWKSDGTAGGTLLVADINVGSDGAFPVRYIPQFSVDFINVNGQLFFGANNGSSGYELWTSDGTVAGTLMVANLNNAGSNGSNPIQLTNVSNTLFFEAESNEFGRELWRTSEAVVQTAPVLNNSLDPKLATIFEDALNPPGTRVSVLLAGAVTDPDEDALSGIAISFAPEASGEWQFLLPGGDWQPMQPSDAAALLLPSDARVRFIPKPNFAGSVKLGYWAWDQTSGNPGETMPLAGNRGGTKSLSSAYETATLTVTAVNDAGSVSISGTPKEDQTLTANVSDPDGVPVSIGYQWQRNTGAGFVAISGATSRTYQLGDADVGATIRVRAVYTDKQGFSENRTSAATSSVINVNDAPELGLGGTVGYVRNNPAFVLAAGAIVTDVDNADFNRGRLRVRIGDGAGSTNVLAIKTGTGFSVDSQNVVRFGNTIVGQRTANGVGTNELIVFFNSDATTEIVEKLVRSITFKTVGGGAGQRKVIFTVSDGKGGVSAEATKTVNVS